MLACRRRKRHQHLFCFGRSTMMISRLQADGGKSYTGFPGPGEAQAARGTYTHLLDAEKTARNPHTRGPSGFIFGVMRELDQ
jgi:hypothetical protein